MSDLTLVFVTMVTVSIAPQPGDKNASHIQRIDSKLLVTARCVPRTLPATQKATFYLINSLINISCRSRELACRRGRHYTIHVDDVAI